MGTWCWLALFVDCMSSLESVVLVLAVSGCMHELPVVQIVGL